jgi:hypothetical protein
MPEAATCARPGTRKTGTQIAPDCVNRGREAAKYRGENRDAYGE